MAQRFEQVDKPLPFRKIMVDNFVGGLFWALGATIGLSLIITFLTLIVHYVNLVPIVGSFISQVIDFILKTNHSLQR
jgi:hypothetical protein